MKKIQLALLLSCIVAQNFAMSPTLKGFAYADEPAPAGNEWESIGQQDSAVRDRPAGSGGAHATSAA